ncbi:Sensory box histidine kinase [Labilithrix luteola]|uniref:histidine kinase n=1 Tax=Labilithrix luteola TaxID=1391654 RepID=A0A0K1QC35_9BACT|nr:ATP-binding protein [Labilithrix luteola]AKV03212.1 Sensory box histidine kinase [Labilithrix luteola]
MMASVVSKGPSHDDRAAREPSDLPAARAFDLRDLTVDQIRERRVVRYGVAVVITTVAYVIQRAIWPYIPPSPQLFFYPAIFLAAWFGGTGPGLAATFVSCVWIAHGFLPPEGFFAVSDASDLLDLGLFASVAAGISAAMGRLRAALRRERAAAREAELARRATEATWSMIAHDLRTPLNVIQLSSSELERRLQDDEPDVERAERAVQVIQRSTTRARDLVQDAMDAMRLAGGAMPIERDSYDARELSAEAIDAVNVLAQRKGVRLSMRIDVTRTIDCDAPRVLQVLSNLLGNAIKFTPAGGQVVLSVEDALAGVRFAVTDTGRGISDEELGAIFARYWTRDRAAGIGLGLWIAKAIVEAHGGTLTVRSRLGEGSTFSFVLPTQSAAHLPENERPSSTW